MAHRPLALRLRSERGAMSWVTIVLLLGLTIGSYLAVVWLPVFFQHGEAKQVVRDFMNRAIKDKNDANLIQRMCDKLALVSQDQVPQPDGTVEKVPAIVVEPSAVTWERDTTVTPPTLRVAFEYVRQVRYPFLERVDETTLEIDLEQSLEVVKW